ncbi:membrane-associated protein, putative, partial [Bodo saltans]
MLELRTVRRCCGISVHHLVLCMWVATVTLGAVTVVTVHPAAPCAFDLSVDASNNIYYVSDELCSLYKIPAGEHVAAPQLIAGGASKTACTFNDATGSAARFYYPRGIAIDLVNNLAYIGDTFNDRIRKVDLATTVVTTFVGSGLSYPTGVVYYMPSSGTAAVLYVADFGNDAVKKIPIATGTASLVVSMYSCSYLAISMDGAYLYVTRAHAVIRVQTSNNAMTTLAGVASDDSNSFVDSSTGTSARFNYPRGIALVANDSALVVADRSNLRIRRVELTAPYKVSTMSGSSTSGTADGTSATFREPTGGKWYCNVTMLQCGFLIADYGDYGAPASAIRFVAMEVYTPPTTTSTIAPTTTTTVAPTTTTTVAPTTTTTVAPTKKKRWQLRAWCLLQLKREWRV